MSARFPDPRVTAYVLDALDSTEREAFEKEMSSDENLFLEVEKRRKLVQSVSESLSQESLGSLTEEQRSNLRTNWLRPQRRKSFTTIEYLAMIALVIAVVSILSATLKPQLPGQIDEVFKGVNAKIKKLMQAGLDN